MRVLVLDNYDSFTWNLVQPLAAWGAECVVRRNDAISLGDAVALAPERVIISPGPFGPDRAGICGALVRAMGSSVPILGVCLGMQVIADAAGATVRASGAPVHGKRRTIRHDGRGVLRGLPDPLRVGLYHSLVVARDSLPDFVTVTAEAEDGDVVMGCRLRGQPVEGVLFHPESFLTDEGDRVLRNFLDGPDVE